MDPIWPAESYQLLDFGGGRKLERFGSVYLDRCSPAAIGTSPRQPGLWKNATAKLDERGRVVSGQLPATWTTSFHSIRFALKLTPFGHTGLFPEQASNWIWLENWGNRRRGTNDDGGNPRPLRALNLFAYTGGTTLVLASLGASVTHVDASAPAVKWARENAELSGLADKPIRWIVEDAGKYVSRELKRGQAYDLIALDPPSYGHGPKGQRWELARDLPELLQNCGELLSDSGRILLTAHCISPSQDEICELFQSTLCRQPETGRLLLPCPPTRSLDAGFFCR